MHNKTLIIRWLQILLIAVLFGISFYPYADTAIYPLIGISLAFGFVTWIGINLVLDSFHRWEEARLIRAALEGQRGVDGKRRAVLGKIYPRHESITAPFSGRECLVVGYDIYHKYFKRTQSSSIPLEPVIYSGYYLASSEIRGSTETVKILGFPDISDVPEQETTSHGNTKAFIEKTDFTQRLKGSFMEGVNDLSKVIRVDENGAAAENYQFRELVPEQSIKSREQVVRKGEDVCLVGVFYAARSGIVPSKFRFGRSMRLIPGTGKQIASSLKKNAGIVVVFGFVVSILCISVGLLPHAPDALVKRLPAGDTFIQYRNEALHSHENRPRKVKREREKAGPEISIPNIEAAIRKGDVDWLQKQLSEGMDPNMHLVHSSGYTLPLFDAIRDNQLKVARLLLEAGADINAAQSGNATALSVAIAGGNPEAVKFLLDAGAKIPSEGAHGLCPLNSAILHQNVNIVTLLLEAGADPSPPESDRFIAALPAEGEKADRIRVLIQEARERKKSR